MVLCHYAHVMISHGAGHLVVYDPYHGQLVTMDTSHTSLYALTTPLWYHGVQFLADFQVE